MRFWNGMVRKMIGLPTDKILVGDLDSNEPQYMNFGDLPFASPESVTDADAVLDQNIITESQSRIQADINEAISRNTAIAQVTASFNTSNGINKQGTLSFNSPAPTPAKNCFYEFTSAGAFPSWLTPTNPITPNVSIGDRASVVFLNPGYSYTYIPQSDKQTKTDAALQNIEIGEKANFTDSFTGTYSDRDSLKTGGIYIKKGSQYSSIMIVHVLANGNVLQTEYCEADNRAIIRNRTFTLSTLTWSEWVDYITQIITNTSSIADNTTNIEALLLKGYFIGSYGSDRDIYKTDGVYVRNVLNGSGILTVKTTTTGNILQIEQTSSDALPISRYRLFTTATSTWGAWTDNIATLNSLSTTVANLKGFTGSFTTVNIDTQKTIGSYLNSATGEILNVNTLVIGRYSLCQILKTENASGIVEKIRYYNSGTNLWENWFSNEIHDVREQIINAIDWKVFSNYTFVIGEYIAMNTKLSTVSASLGRTNPILLSTLGKAFLVSLSTFAGGMIPIAFYSSSIIAIENYVGMDMIYAASGVLSNHLITNIPPTATHVVVSNSSNLAVNLSISIPVKSSNSTNPNCIVKYNFAAKKFSIYVKDNNDKSVYYSFDVSLYQDDADLNYWKLWKINGGKLCSYDLGVMTETVTNTVLGTVESEFAFKFNNKADYTGGYHGDERIDTAGSFVNFYIDGVKVSDAELLADFQLECDNFYYLQSSTLHDTAESATPTVFVAGHPVVARHIKKTTFKNAGYETINKVTFQLSSARTLYEYFSGLCCMGKAFADFAYAEDYVVRGKFIGDSATYCDMRQKGTVEYWSVDNGLSAQINSRFLSGIDDSIPIVSIWDRVGDTKYYRKALLSDAISVQSNTIESIMTVKYNKK
jgi:hypothetical protein